MQLTKGELAEVAYIVRHPGHFWGGPEIRGGRPMHETDPVVRRYVRLGLIEHVPGRGYEVTERARAIAVAKRK